MRPPCRTAGEAASIRGGEMPGESIETEAVLPATAKRIYDAWLDADDHASMTGGAAASEGAVIGARFTAWDGYIEGRHLLLEPGRRIVQAWRTTDFPAGAADSRLELRLSRTARGTRVTILHSRIPPSQGASYREGWREHYFEPMRRFFAAEARRRARSARPPWVKAGKARRTARRRDARSQRR